jgi:hypothetical protein
MTTHRYIGIWPGGPCGICMRAKPSHETEVRCWQPRCGYTTMAPEEEHWRILRVHNATVHSRQVQR